jgi:chemotaxis response regulator CheB
LKGSKDIEQNGGFVMVQSMESSQFTGMPETIINKNDLKVNADPNMLALQLLQKTNSL